MFADKRLRRTLIDMGVISEDHPAYQPSLRTNLYSGSRWRDLMAFIKLDRPNIQEDQLETTQNIIGLREKARRQEGEIAKLKHRLEIQEQLLNSLIKVTNLEVVVPETQPGYLVRRRKK